MKKRIMTILSTLVMVFGIVIILPQTSFATQSTLQSGTPEQESMLSKPLEDIDENVEEAIDEDVMPGAVVMVVRNGNIVKQDAFGYAARYMDDDFTEMDDPVEMQEDTIFDMASISKLFTATAVMQLWDQDYFEMDDPVSDYVSEYDTEEKRDITIQQLLTHTSGEKAEPDEDLYEMNGDREELLEYTMEEPLENEPGEAYVYSDINYITLGVLVERLSDEREDDYVETHILDPLELSNTMYNPSEDVKQRIAATEFQPWTNRDIVHGSVHDEKAWALDGVAGHAGVFSSAEDMATFSQMLLNKGSYDGESIVSEEAFDLMNTNWNEAFPGQDHGLGWELNQDWYMDVLAEKDTLGHTGFTGTSIVVSPKLDTAVILLTNHVHPIRDVMSTNDIRKKVAEKTASSIYARDADSMQSLVESLKDKGEFSEESAAESLDVHLAAVKRFEKTDQQEKVLKHLDGFQNLLDHQRDEELISDDAYDSLARNTEYLIEEASQ